MTATKLTLPGVDPEEKAERDRRWLEELDPQTETQAQLAQRVLTAADQRDCCDRAFSETITSQVQTADDRFDQELEDSLTQGKRLFQTDPAQAVALLSQTSLGCQWLLQRKSELRERLVRHGFLLDCDMREWLALNGETEEEVPTQDRLPIQSPTPLAFTVVFHGYMTQPVADKRCSVRTSCCLRGVPSAARPALIAKWSDPKANLEVLLRQLDREIAELQERLATLQGREQRRRPAYAAQALLIDPPPKGGLWNRYSKDADTALYRALKEYWAEKAREAARQAEASDPDPDEKSGIPEELPPEESPAASPLNSPPGASDRSRNEPGAGVCATSTSCDTDIYDANLGMASDISEGLRDPTSAAWVAAMSGSPLNWPDQG
jgi:hypothetical protein